MSDLFKDHGPKLSDDEDRRLWQRVRAIPGEAAPVRAPWWQVLWTMPAVRYGAPAFAVLLVAVVWVAERRPEPPARIAAKAAVPAAEAPAPANTNAPFPMAQAPTAARKPEAGDTRKLQDLSKDQAADRADGGAVLERELTLPTAPQAKAAPPPAPPAAVQAERKSARFAAEPGASGAPAASSAPAAPAAPARDELALKSAPAKESARNEAAPKAASAPSITSWGSGTIRAGAAVAPPRAIDHAAGDRLAVGTLPSAAELARHAILSDVLDPAHGGDLNAWVRLPEGAPWAPAGWPENWTVVVGSSETGATGVAGEMHGKQSRPVDYNDAPSRSQVAVLAYLFEMSLAAPERGQLEALRKAALAIDPAAGGYGRSRLLTLLAGALGAAPAR